MFYLIFWLWRRSENKVTRLMIKQFLGVLSVEAYLVIGLQNVEELMYVGYCGRYCLTSAEGILCFSSRFYE